MNHRHRSFVGALGLLAACAAAPAQERPDIVWSAAGTVRAVAYSPDGALLAASSDDRSTGLSTVTMRRVHDGAIVRVIDPRLRNIRSLDFSPDGARLVAGGLRLGEWGAPDRFDCVRVWRVADGALLLSIYDYLRKTKAVKFTPDGTELVVLAEDGRAFTDRHLSFYRASTGARLRWYGAGQTDMELPCMDLTRDGTVVACSLYGRVRLFRAADLAVLGDLATNSALTVAFSPDGHTLASAGFGPEIWLWRTADGSHLRTLVGHTENKDINSVAFSRDGSVLASTSYDGMLRLWDPTTGDLLRTYTTGRAGKVAFSPDGAFFAYSSSVDGLVLARNPYAPFAGSEMAVADASGPIGSDVTVSARLTSTGAGLSGKTVSFTIDGDTGEGVTDSTGLATVTYRVPERGGPGPRAVWASFAGDAGFGPSSGAGTLTVTRADTFVYVIDRTGAVGRTVYLRGYLYRSTDRERIGGRTMSFAVDGTPIGNALGDANGRATLEYIPPSGSAGSHWVHVGFAGDAAYAASAALGRLEVARLASTLWVLSRTEPRGTQTYLRAYLRRLPDLAWLGGKTVAFTLDGTPIGSAVTEAANGRASVLYAIAPDMALGAHPIAAAFAGDADFTGSDAVGTLTVTP